MAEKISDIYKAKNIDHFPGRMEIAFIDGKEKTVLAYEKVEWNIDGIKQGLRYGENPDQEAGLYRLINGNLRLGQVETLKPGRYLSSDIELLQSGKHPGKINITDIDSALNILRFFSGSPCCVIVKHNNPCGAAKGGSAYDAFQRAFLSDRLAAFGGAVALNREIDIATAEAIAENYVEVIAAPEFSSGALSVFEKKKNLRVMRIRNMERLETFVGSLFLDFTSLIDGGLILQTSYQPKTLRKEDFLPAETEYKGKLYRVDREPTEQEYDDMLFGWLVESGVTSNSVLYVKDGRTLGIGTGEQDRVGVAEIARDKAYKKLQDRLAFEKYSVLFSGIQDTEQKAEIEQEVLNRKADLPGSIMISDGFFPFRDGIDIGLKEGVSAVVEPGGSLRDFESILACNEFGACMKFTGQRSFRH